MASRSVKIRLGVFMASALALLVVMFLLLMGKEIRTHTSYTVRFPDSVSGLDPGAPVKLRGVRVGAVERIQIDPDNVELVEVTVSIRSGTPIKEDHQAVLNMQGISGIRFVELRGGTTDSKPLPPGGEIEAGRNLLDRLTGSAASISEKANLLMDRLLLLTRPDNREVVEATLENLNQLVVTLEAVTREAGSTNRAIQTLVNESRPGVRSTLSSIAASSQHLDRTLSNLDSAIGDVRQTLAASEIPETTHELRRASAAARGALEQVDAQRAIESVLATLGSLRQVLNGLAQTVGQNQESIRLTIHNLRQASESLKELSQTFQEKPVIQMFGDTPAERDLP